MNFEEIVASIKTQRPNLQIEQRNDGIAIYTVENGRTGKRLLRVSRQSTELSSVIGQHGFWLMNLCNFGLGREASI
jgi:hypothetical protein